MIFSANLSTMFREVPMLDRFKEAKKCGFSHFEIQSPYDMEPADILKNMCGMKCVVVNSYSGDDFGCASIPGREMEFCASLNKALEYREVLNFDKVHILSGKRCPDITVEEQVDVLVRALDSATDFLEDQNLIGLIEPICPEVKENYFLSSFDMAIKVIKATSNSNVKLLLDIYHLHKLTKDVKGNLAKYYPYAGHIQISQDPGRREPFYPGGNIDYGFVLNFLQEKGHKDPIGLEYVPSESTATSLDWMKKYI